MRRARDIGRTRHSVRAAPMRGEGGGVPLTRRGTRRNDEEPESGARVGQGSGAGGAVWDSQDVESF
eukprot:6086289-Prymnesium_polylepis.2